MIKVTKGQPGYFKYRKNVTRIAMITGYMMVMLFFFTGLFIYADKKNFFTVLATVSMLPTAKMTVNFLMYPRSGIATKEGYDRIKSVSKDMIVLCDLYITPEKKSIELPYAVVYPNNVIIFCNDKKLDTTYHTEFINKFMLVDGLSPYFNFYSDFDKFVNRVKVVAINEPNEYTDEQLAQIENIAHHLTILSI